MPAALNSFKRVCVAAADVVAIVLATVLLALPAGCFAVFVGSIMAAAGASRPGLIHAWSMWIAFVLSYLLMAAVYLFRTYGSRPGFIRFCIAHPRFRAITTWAVDSGTAVWGRISAAIDVAAGLIERLFALTISSIAVLIVVLVVGVISYSLFGVLSAPWWAIGIIFLLFAKK